MRAAPPALCGRLRPDALRACVLRCSGQPGPGRSHPHCKTFLLKISSHSPLFQLKTVPLVLSLPSLIQRPPQLSWSPFHGGVVCLRKSIYKMATAQKQRNCVSAVVFPNKISTEQQSLMLVKRLLAVAVSCITYLRGIFPESAYGTRYMDDVCVKILREDKNCPGSAQLVKWMLGCYDALQKKYLRMIVLAVYTHPEDPQTITECYHFKFKYTHNGPLLDFGSKNKRNDSTITCADTKKASMLLIRKIYVLMQNLSPLPNDVCLTMKLFYYDEVTPSDYQPPGFKEGDCEGVIFEGEPMYLNVGEVPTPFHMLKVKVTTEKQRMENVDRSILKHGESNVPLQVLNMDREDAEENEDMNEDPVLANEVEDGNTVTISEAQEPNLTCDEDEVTKAGGSQNLCVSNPQVDHLASKTSELNMSESRTRSGKIFQTSTVHQFELSSSQDVLPKRRKMSEPTEQF
ncbi:HORMA domain-containing protein 1 isoform X2 [Cuculus canorus]|uniref:HORMA domain-containing protein 1 isoform X2 n=1 Tax=Cuculus canorus TaxID=55661 RepID=UPI0023AA7FBB|nr:HORMA domain-containing protein 1 isoform X2 [Cuculus canorus]